MIPFVTNGIPDIDRPRLLTVPLLVLLLLLANSSEAQTDFDFPGPVIVDLRSPATSLTPVRGLPLSERLVVAGTEDGFLALTEFRPEIGKVVVLGRVFVGGTPVALKQDPETAGQATLAVACKNPDSLVFFDLQLSDPFFVETQSFDLPEDPLGISTVAIGPSRKAGLVVSLPGMDRILIFVQEQSLWRILQELPAGDGPAQLAAGDLDLDGRDEIYVSQQGFLSENISIFLQDDLGGFYRDQEYDPGFNPGPVKIMDVDGDGLSELILGGLDQPLAVILERAAGTLSEREMLSLKAPVSSLDLATLADGSVGLYTADRDQGLVDISTLAAGSWTVRQPYYPGCLPLGILAHDFNADGQMDLITAGEPSGFTVMFGVTDATFWGFPALPLIGTPLGLVLVDIDRDGRNDAVTIYQDEQVLTINPGGSNGGLDSQRHEVPLGFIPDRIVELDPGLAEGEALVVSDARGSRLVVLEISPDNVAVGLDTLDVVGFVDALRSADLDGDGQCDLLALLGSVQQVLVFFGDGFGKFSPPVVLATPLLMRDINILDFNADGLLDVALGGVGRSVGVFPNLDGHSFGAAQWWPINGRVDQLVAGDFDGDFDRDLVAVDGEGQSLTMLENNGLGELLLRLDEYPLDSEPGGVVTGDVNADGRPEILVNLRSAGKVGAVLVGEHWEYGVTLTFPSSGNVSLLASGDVNSDSVVDLLVMDETLELGLVMLNEKRNLVAIDPGALSSYCTVDGPRFQITPSHQGSWVLSGKRAGEWVPLARKNWTAFGELVFDKGAWLWDPGPELFRLFPAAATGTRVQLRLTEGVGPQEETLDILWLDPCASDNPSHGTRTLSWARPPWPNPFNPTLAVSLGVIRPAGLTVQVLDLRGRVVASLFQGWATTGILDLSWDGMTAGGPASSGLYFILARTDSDQVTSKIMLAR